MPPQITLQLVAGSVSIVRRLVSRTWSRCGKCVPPRSSKIDVLNFLLSDYELPKVLTCDLGDTLEAQWVETAVLACWGRCPGDPLRLDLKAVAFEGRHDGCNRGVSERYHR